MKKVFARIGFADVIVPIEDIDKPVTSNDTFVVGYELANGVECYSDGTPLEPVDVSNWLTFELFDYALLNELIDEDSEFEAWKHSRDTLVHMVEEHINS